MLQSSAHELFHQLAVQSHRFFLELCLCIYKSQWGASSRTSRLLEPFSCFSSTQTFVDMPPPQESWLTKRQQFCLKTLLWLSILKLLSRFLETTPETEQKGHYYIQASAKPIQKAGAEMLRCPGWNTCQNQCHARRRT